MKVGIFAFTSAGVRLAQQVAACLSGASCRLSVPERLGGAAEMESLPVVPRKQLSAAVKEWFPLCDALVFIGAAGIAVRAVAPFLVSKGSDPAVLCLDEKGQFVIPLAGGHLGGANRLASQLAKGIGAVCVLTTSTDVNQRFAVDSWAADVGLHICNLEGVKVISARLLEGLPIGFSSDYPVEGSLPPGIFSQTEGEAGILISARQGSPFKTTLRLVPKNLAVGIGCRKGASFANVEQTILRALGEKGLELQRVARLASVDLKAEEPAILELAAKWRLPFSVYPPQRLNQLAGSFSASDFVRSVTQVDCVCERAACISGGKLLVKKTIGEGVTIQKGN